MGIEHFSTVGGVNLCATNGVAWGPTCSKCGEPLSLPLKGFEDQALTDACYCVGCRPEETKQLRLQIKGSL